MRRVAIRHPTRQPLVATEDDIAAVNSRISLLDRAFTNSIRELTDRIERVSSRLHTIEVHVGELMAQAHAERIRVQTPQVNVVMPGTSGAQVQSTDMDVLQSRLRRQELEIDALRDRFSTMLRSLDAIQDDVRAHRRTIDDIGPTVQRMASDAADQRFARIAYEVPSMLVADMVARFDPQINAFQIPEFRDLPNVERILNRAIDGFRATQLIGNEPQLRLTFDAQPQEELPKPDHEDDLF
jgi:hypothetical protein